MKLSRELEAFQTRLHDGITNICCAGLLLIHVRTKLNQ